MAEPSNPLTLEEFGTLREGLLATANKSARPLSKFGIDYSLTPQDIALGSLPAVGGLYNIANALNQARVNQIARGQVGQEPLSFFQEVTKGDFSATQQLQDKIKDQYGAVNRETIQDYFMKNNPELDLAPLTYKMYDKQELEDDPQLEQVNLTQPFAKGSSVRSIGFKGNYNQPEMLMTETGKFDAPTGRTYAEAIRAGAYDNEIKSVDQFAEDNIKQSNIGQRDPKTGDFIPSKTYDPAFARAVTLEQQGDTANQGTFICTALYNQGLLPRKIYACDVIYGKGINFYTYKGYEVWGKWFAKKLKNNKMVFKIFHPVFVQWANQMAFEVSGGKYGKNNTFIKILKRTGETISNIIGRIAERRKRWSTQ